MSKIQTKKVVFFMIPIPKFILKKYLRPIWYFKSKPISLAKTWWHGIWIKVKIPILISSNVNQDQSLEFPFEAPTPPHEENHEEEPPATSPKQEFKSIMWLEGLED